MSTAKEFQQSTQEWHSLGGLWERAALIRAFLWHQHYDDPKALLVQFSVRLKRFFSIDFCAGGLIEGEHLIYAAVPEAGLEQLPGNFARRCLDLVAHARAPITWNEVKAEFGFRSMVVAPVVPPAGAAVGFLLLGHSSRRVYSAAELFVLQNLASELAWVAREMQNQKEHRLQVADLSHDIKNTLQLIIGYSGLMRQNLNGVLGTEQEEFLTNIESDVERILRQLTPSQGDLTVDDESLEMIAATPESSAATNQSSNVSKSVYSEKY